MDVDENTAQQQQQQQQPQGNDIEQSFLQQFSCLGTTDHDELVGRFQKLLGNQLNYTTARFFLDMNNWNLPAAVGCYFDFYSGQKLPSMQIIAEVTVGEGESVTPETSFQQSWKVQNNGEDRWPEGCYMKCTSAIELASLSVPALNPGETTVLTVQLVSPNELGSFQTKWRLCTPNGSNFGDTIWAIVQVTPTGTLAITQQLSHLNTHGTGNTVETLPIYCSSLVPIPLPPIPSTIYSSISNETNLSTTSTSVNLPNSPSNPTDDNDMC